MGSQASGYKRKAPVALAGAFKSGPTFSQEDGNTRPGTNYTMDEWGSESMLLPNKSLTQNDLAAWGMLSGIKKAPREAGLVQEVGGNANGLRPPCLRLQRRS